MKDFILGVYNEEYLQYLKANTAPETFLEIVTILADHSLRAQAELSYDMNAACNSIMLRFPGKTSLTVSEVHQTLRDLGIVDYDPADMGYIEAVLKKFGVLITAE